MTIDELLKAEQSHRKAGKWLSMSDLVTADNGITVLVHLKSFGMYNQILRFEEHPTNYCSGHTITKVKEMQKYLRDQINSIAISLSMYGGPDRLGNPEYLFDERTLDHVMVGKQRLPDEIAEKVFELYRSEIEAADVEIVEDTYED